MSGYKHSGLTEEEYEDREILLKAIEIIKKTDCICADIMSDMLKDHARHSEGGEQYEYR